MNTICQQLPAEKHSGLKVHLHRGPFELTLQNALADCIQDNLAWLQDEKTCLTVASALKTLQTQQPYVWAASIKDTSGKTEVLAASSLEILPNAVLLHGISAQHYRTSTILRPLVRKAISLCALAALETNFSDLSTGEIWAPIGQSNLAAKGFCWRLGFQKVHPDRLMPALITHFEDVYRLSARQYTTFTRPILIQGAFTP